MEQGGVQVPVRGIRHPLYRGEMYFKVWLLLHISFLKPHAKVYVYVVSIIRLDICQVLPVSQSLHVLSYDELL